MFVMKMNKITVFLETNKINFVHCNMFIDWFEVES